MIADLEKQNHKQQKNNDKLTKCKINFEKEYNLLHNILKTQILNFEDYSFGMHCAMNETDTLSDCIQAEHELDVSNGINTHVPTGSEKYRKITKNTILLCPDGKIICIVIQESKNLNTKDIINALQTIEKMHPKIKKKSSPTTGSMYGAFWCKAYSKNPRFYEAKKQFRKSNPLHQAYKRVCKTQCTLSLSLTHPGNRVYTGCV